MGLGANGYSVRARSSFPSPYHTAGYQQHTYSCGSSPSSKNKCLLTSRKF